jgi:two-component system chemotaxis sensor kinase CheA
MSEYLLFSLSDKSCYSVPLALVSRLEEFKAEAISVSGDEYFVKYRGGLLSLIFTDQYVTKQPRPIDLKGTIYAVVISKNNRFFGFVVNEIVDIITSASEISGYVKDRPGLLGTIVTEDQKVITIIDCFALIEQAMGLPPAKKIKAKKKANILLVEDTAFFVKQITKVLEGAGHSVTHAEIGEEAYRLLKGKGGSDFELIVSDIEMPKMNGFELAERIRQEQKFAQIPLIALTTRFREDDQARGKRVGFTEYLEKLKSDELIETINHLLGGTP